MKDELNLLTKEIIKKHNLLNGENKGKALEDSIEELDILLTELSNDLLVMERFQKENKLL